MKYERLTIPDVVKITPKKYSDNRGYFMETFRTNEFCEFIGSKVNFVQDNHSLSIHANTVRGLHFQSPPYAQGKLVRCIKGKINDVAVDVRKGSATYGKYVLVELSAENACQLWIPEGFLHGFVTLETHSEVEYKCTNYYEGASDGGISWEDPTLAIDWGINTEEAVLSDKDKHAQHFKDFNTPF